MKKTLTALIITFLLTLTCGLGLTACQEPPAEHVCAFDKQVETQAYCVSPATCTQKAKYHYSCECGAVGEETFEVGSALGHLFTVYVSNNDATCEQDGTKTATCNRNCGAVDTVTDTGSALGHLFTVYVSNKDATCEQDGTKTATCNRNCGAVDTVTDTGSALGHIYRAWLSNGNGTHSKICVNNTTHVITETCHGGEEIEGQRKICDDCQSYYGEVIGHKYVIEVTPATCTEPGYTTHTCACGDSYITDEVPALQHDYSDWTSNGNGTHSKVCANDSTHVLRGDCHGGERIEGERKICEDCKSPYGEVIGHEFTTIETQPTCTEKGFTTYTCECGYSYKDNYVDALNHDLGAWLYDSQKGHYAVCKTDASHVVTVGVVTGNVLYSADDRELDFFSLRTALAEKGIDISSPDEIDGYIVNGTDVDNLVLDVIISGTGKDRKVDVAQSVTIKVKGETVLLTNVYAYTKIIDAAEDLNYFTLTAKETANRIDGYFIVVVDIDAKDLVLREHTYETGKIYPATSTTQDIGFTGVFDGQGHYIDNLTVNSTGLFGTATCAVFKNIAFTNATLSGYYPTLLSQLNIVNKSYNGALIGGDGAISNVYVSIKDIKKTTGTRIGLLINTTLAPQISVNNVIVDYSNVSQTVQEFISAGKTFYAIGSSTTSMANATNAYKDTYVVSIVPVMSSSLPGFAQNQVEYTLTGGKVTAVGKVLDEQVNTVLGYFNKTLSVDHVIVGLRAYDNYEELSSDYSNAGSIKTFEGDYWIVINGVPYWKSSYYRYDIHDYTEEVVMNSALKSDATCTHLAVYYKSCKCGAIGHSETFETGELLNHYYTEEVVKEDALISQGSGNTLSVYYKSCVCGKVSEDETEIFEVKTMVGKNVIVFGDSYSSYIGTIPEGNAPYYNGDNILSSPDQMWWSLLTKERGGTIIRNDSWSGSTIGYTGYGGNDWSKSKLSFINRLENLVKEGFFEQNQIDVVYIFGGTNDSWCNAPLGEEKYSDWTKEDLHNVLPAIIYFYNRVREILPNAEIYGIANCGLKQEVIDAIVHACEFVNGNAVVLEGIETSSSHPSALGMQQIKNQILAVFDKE